MNQTRYTHIRPYLGVYLVTDERDSASELLQIVEDAIHGGVTTVQLRCKNKSGREFVDIAKQVRTLTRKHDVLFFVNDRVDVAVIVDADGVHVGQDDIAVKDVRRMMGDKWVGVSAHTVEEAQIAQVEGADYIGVGAVYPTRSKLDAESTGLVGLSAIRRAVDIPIVGIGGITLDNAKNVFAEGADGVAVVSTIMQADSPKVAAACLKSTAHQFVRRR